MNKKLKTEKEPKSKIKIRDSKPKKDLKGGTSLNYGGVKVEYKPQK